MPGNSRYWMPIIRNPADWPVQALLIKWRVSCSMLLTPQNGSSMTTDRSATNGHLIQDGQ